MLHGHQSHDKLEVLYRTSLTNLAIQQLSEKIYIGIHATVNKMIGWWRSFSNIFLVFLGTVADV